ncbi:MAG: FKBP-type peptidyl-prolyl cis-trans isomerase [Nitrososphaerota archaeon]|nr:FKBP-type peptidyl-prolyl cis-trans isomerase [Nitrososphaerota archaeon]
MSDKSAEPEIVQQVIKEGDLVLADYTIRVKETGELIETTMESVVKEEGLQVSGKFEPRLIIPGRGLMLKAFEERLIGMAPGEEKRFEIPPEKAFGPRDPSKIKVIPLRRLRDVEGPIVIGTRLVVDGKEGVVRSIGSGRVQVDFNPYLAGKTLDCYVKVTKILTDKLEKIKALIHYRIPDVEVEKFKVKTTKSSITISVPDEAMLLPTIQVSKRALARDLMEYIEGIEKVVFNEVFTKQGSQ